jgi:hypothetical protein
MQQARCTDDDGPVDPPQSELQVSIRQLIGGEAQLELVHVGLQGARRAGSDT